MPHAANRSPQRIQAIKDHLVWIPRDPKMALVGPVAAREKSCWRKSPPQCGFEILAVEVMPDHVRVLVSVPPKFVLAESIRLFKGVTSRKLKKEPQSLRRRYRGKQAALWTERDCIGPAGHMSTETIHRSAQSRFASMVCGFAGRADDRAAVHPPVVVPYSPLELPQGVVTGHPL